MTKQEKSENDCLVNRSPFLALQARTMFVLWFEACKANLPFRNVPAMM